ncbi:hypothetical protein DAPPUDRAFT_314918 [Daphnia pulex]|uniref:Uncharacterized protein n=1 Tax=Daphnia pulex TaxID=6669 RepID=E9G7X8_DAPPU|nr:hypothetical protein DAPPUDRAFT_314918 [Daphnia pulex]|eukprot:EFX84584.1 hypothetical protein DAPPUDRAFT_314918 [Daphnia pulex]
MSIGIRSISYYRDCSSKEMSDELEKYVFKGLDTCGGYCLHMKIGKFLKVVQSNVRDGKSLKGLFPKIVFVVPMQTNIMIDSNYSVDMINCFS